MPDEVQNYSLLTLEQIIEDGDEGASEIYNFPELVETLIKADIARAFVDLNRSPDDRRDDGVVKTKTCMNESIYNSPLPEHLVELLISRYYTPYHRRLSHLAQNAKAGIDCHTMFAKSPPISDRPGVTRPHICLGNGYGTCSDKMINEMASSFANEFGESNVTINEPFAGGYIIKKHSAEIPWIQIEVSREPFMKNQDKKEKIISAVTAWAKRCLL